MNEFETFAAEVIQRDTENVLRWADKHGALPAFRLAISETHKAADLLWAQSSDLNIQKGSDEYHAMVTTTLTLEKLMAFYRRGLRASEAVENIHNSCEQTIN